MRWLVLRLSAMFLASATVAAWLAIISGAAPDTATHHELDAASRRWIALSFDERSRYTRIYEQIARRHDAANVIRAGDRFSEMSPGRRKRLSDLHAEINAFIANRPIADRTLLRRMPSGTRARLLHEMLERDAPEKLYALREMIRAPQNE